MKIKEIVAFYSLFNALSLSCGFTANRTEWSVVPQLNPWPQVSVEVLMKDGQAKGIDDALRSSKEKKSLKRENVTIAKTPLREKSHPENQSNLIVHLVTEPELRFDHREKFIKGSRKNSPLNVILLLIDGLDDAEEDLKMDLENSESFPIQGFLQSCPEKPNADPEAFYFSERNMNCDCEDLLRSNIVSLLSWAQLEREMSTSSIYEMPTVYSRRIEMDSQNFMSPAQVRRIDRELHESTWQPNDARRSRAERKRPQTRKDNKSQGHVSGVLSRLREAFFRTLLRSLSGSNAEQKLRSFPPRGSSNFRELAARTLEELNSMPNEKGYVLIASTGVHELTDALQLFRLYVSPLDTLIIVTSSCPRTKSSLIPYFARGPHSEAIIEANPSSLEEIPSIIRGIISHECSESACGRESPILTFGDPILIISDEEMPLERFARHERTQNKTHQKLKRSEKEPREKVPEAKNTQETKAITTRTTADKRDENSKTKTMPLDVQIQLRMGDETPVKNYQVINSPSTVIFLTIVTISTTFAL